MFTEVANEKGSSMFQKNKLESATDTKKVVTS